MFCLFVTKPFTSRRTASQFQCRPVFKNGTSLGRPRRIRWRVRWERGSGWGIHVNPWLIHITVWQKPLQYCKVISLQLIKISGKKNGTLVPTGKFLQLVLHIEEFSMLRKSNLLLHISDHSPLGATLSTATVKTCWIKKVRLENP